MINHAWANNALRCCGARIKALRPDERYSWAYYRIERERVTLGALFYMATMHNCRTYLEAKN